MNIEETKEAIKVMQAFVDGKEIELIFREGRDTWEYCVSPLGPGFDWSEFKYRIAEPEPVEIEVGMAIIHNDTRRKNFYTYRIEVITPCCVCYSIDGNDLTATTLEELTHDWHTIVNGTKRKLKAPEANK